MYESHDEQSKREFYYNESNNNKKNNFENDGSVTLYICNVCLKSKKINLLLTSTAWSLRENMYAPRRAGSVQKTLQAIN